MRISANDWTPAADRYLRANYNRMTDTELGEVVHRTKDAVKHRRARLGLIKGFPPPPLDGEEDAAPEMITEVTPLNLRAAACGMSYGQYTGATQENRERALAEKRGEKRERHINPWAIAVRV